MPKICEKKKLLVTGASGFLGWNIIRKVKSNWDTCGTFLAHGESIPGCTLFQIDLTRYADLKNLFEEIEPDAVIHTAAMSDPNFCQQHRSDAYKINTEASVHIAGLCADRYIPCLFTSSDLVFDGRHPPYREQDPVSPVNVYGEHKVLAEMGMKKRYPETVICRMSLMFGVAGPVAQSFIQPLIMAMKSGAEIDLFVDEYRTPVSGKDAADGLMLSLNKLPGIIHLGGAERISRYDFGRLLTDVFRFSDAALNPCSQKEHTMPAPRPPDISFDISKAKALGFRPNSLKAELKHLRNAVDV